MKTDELKYLNYVWKKVFDKMDTIEIASSRGNFSFTGIGIG